LGGVVARGGSYQPPRARGTCSYCGRPAVYNGRVAASPLGRPSNPDAPTRNLCSAHYARMMRGTLPMDAPIRGVYRDEWDRLMAACDAREAAETDLDMDRAEHRIRESALAWAATKMNRSEAA